MFHEETIHRGHDLSTEDNLFGDLSTHAAAVGRRMWKSPMVDKRAIGSFAAKKTIMTQRPVGKQISTQSNG